MPLNEEQKKSVLSAIESGLDRAEENWSKEGKKLMKIACDSIAIEAARVTSIIPGHPLVEDGKPNVADFISVMIDMRDSTKKLTSSTGCGIHGFQRIYYETSALLPAIYVVSGFSEGIVTEYLGDGALVLHKFTNNEQARDVAFSALAYVDDMRSLLNQTIYSRYNLPQIDIGVGVSMGPALVTLVGHENNVQAKAIGECVWEASKLSCGRNKMYISQSIQNIWPKSRGGKISFGRHSAERLRGVHGYYIIK
jgi:class 3 adenylate cyclase